MIKFEDIKKANESIITTDIKGKDYAEVNQRIKAFRMCFPNGTIESKIVSLENGVVIMKAEIKDEEGKLLGTGYAYEKENSTFINKTSYIENCETSATGRALGMCGFGIDTSVASAEEVLNAMENQKKAAPEIKTKNIAKEEINAPQVIDKDHLAALEKLDDKLKQYILKRFNVSSLSALTMKDAIFIINSLKAKAEGK